MSERLTLVVYDCRTKMTPCLSHVPPACGPRLRPTRAQPALLLLCAARHPTSQLSRTAAALIPRCSGHTQALRAVHLKAVSATAVATAPTRPSPSRHRLLWQYERRSPHGTPVTVPTPLPYLRRDATHIILPMYSYPSKGQRKYLSQ